MSDDTEEHGIWYTPTRLMKLADGSYLLKPGKPIQRTCARTTSKLTGLSLKTLRALSDMGLIRCAKPSVALTLYYPAEVEEFLEETEQDPDFWNKARSEEYLKYARKRWGKKTRETS